MCILIVLSGVDPDYPLIVASNRDEERERRGSPPGLFVTEPRKILSPRDRRADGTWIAVNDVGLFAGLTNVAGVEVDPSRPTRGVFPHLALSAANVDDAVAAVESALELHDHNPFQLVVADGSRSAVLRFADGTLDRLDAGASAVVVTNEHRAGELELPGLDAAQEPGIDLDERFARLRELLLDTGERSGHRVLKRGGAYGTVSSSLLAIRPGEPRSLVWKFAPGPPDETEFRNYSNLSRRLV